MDDWIEVDTGGGGAPTAPAVGDAEGGVGTRFEVTRAHWKDGAPVKMCEEPGCTVRFDPVKYRKQHCRRCGNVYCAKHVELRRKLSPNATPDAINGVWCQVCIRCFDKGPQIIGFARNYSEAFRKERNEINRRKRGDMEILLAMVDTASRMDVTAPPPDVKACFACRKSFGILVKKRFLCQICKEVHCQACVGNTAIDTSLNDEASDEDDWEILKQDTKLVTCGKCNGELAVPRHLAAVQDELRESRRHALIELHDRVVDLRRALETQIARYEEAVNTTVDQPVFIETVEPSASAGASSREQAAYTSEQFQRVSDLQRALLVLFREYEASVREIATRFPIDSQGISVYEAKLRSNLLKAAGAVLKDQLPQYKVLTRDVGKADLKTATNVAMIIERVGVELASPQMPRNLRDGVRPLFGRVATEIRRDLRQAAVDSGEDWDAHLTTLNTLVAEWSPPLFKLDGTPNSTVIVQRCVTIVRHNISQMQTKVGKQRLQRSFAALEAVLADLQSLQLT